MRKYVMLLSVMAALVVPAAGIATAEGGEGPTTVKVGWSGLNAAAGFSPKVLSRTDETPITFVAEGEVTEDDGAHPPALREVRIEADKALEVHTKGIPTCRFGGIQVDATEAAEEACRQAQIGTGTATAQVAFAEEPPINVNSKLLVFNGGESDGKTTLFIPAYFSAPISGVLLITVSITKHENGRFGSLAIAKIPQIAAGSGSITKFQVTIDKDVMGENPISAKCDDGMLKFDIEGRFEDGTEAARESIRACTPKD